MADLTIHIKQLNIKLQLLLKKYALLSQENEQQKKTIICLQESDKNKKEQLDVLQQQQLILKASLDKMDEKEKKELEQKLNGYVRNIDKCISLLSHKQNL